MDLSGGWMHPASSNSTASRGSAEAVEPIPLQPNAPLECQHISLPVLENNAQDTTDQPTISPPPSSLATQLTLAGRLSMNMMAGWQRAPSTTIVFICSLCLLFVQFSVTTAVLVQTYGGPCDQPLWRFLVMMDVVTLCMILITILEAIWMIPVGQSFYYTLRGQRLTKITAVFEYVGITVYLLGNMWFYSTNANSCLPLLYYLSLAWIIYGYILFLLPLIFFGMIVCCLPLAMIILRQRNGPAAPDHLDTHRGLTQQVINTIPTKRFKGKSKRRLSGNDVALPSSEAGKDEEGSCSICLSEFTKSDVLRVLPCQHEFHVECLDHWLKMNGSCPLCVRRAVDPVSEPDHPESIV